MQSIFGITRKELEEYFISIGEKKIKATQVYEWIYRKGARSFDEMSNISKETINKLKEDIISKRIKSALSLDNLGIFANTISDPTGNKVEQLQKYTDFIELIDKTYQTFSNELTNDEKVIYKKTLLSNMPDSEVMEMLCLTNNTSKVSWF